MRTNLVPRPRRVGTRSFKPLLEWLEGRDVPAIVVGLTAANEIVTFDSSTPQFASTPLAINGLDGTLIGIDYRPANGKLYGVTDADNLYTIDISSGEATQVGATFATAIDGTAFGFDFNPAKDAIRIVTDTGKNYRVNPDTATLIQDTDLNGDSTNLVGAAYTNNFAGTGTTQLFAIDPDTDKLAEITDPDGGANTFVGDLGVDTDTGTGFDIGANGVAYAALTVAGVTSLYTLDVSNGTATAVDLVGDGTTSLIGLSITEKASRAYALDAAGDTLLSFNTATAGVIDRSVDIIAQDGDALSPVTLVGIDFRPSTGQLYGVSADSKLYIIDPISGSATQIGGGQFAIALEGTEFGVDFNPAVDKLRIVSNTGQNIRVNPLTGEVVDADPGTDGFQADGPISGDVTGVTAAAYDNNNPGVDPADTTLFGIDDSTNKLVTITPANDGTTTTVGDLGITVEAVNGFDISPADGTAYAALTDGGVTNLYTIDLATGTATLLSTIGDGSAGVRGLTIAPAPRAVTLFGTDGTNLYSFSSDAPDVPLTPTAITGLSSDLIGIDFRPADGKLYGVTADGSLYTIDTGAAVATKVNTDAFTPALDGSFFGLDFNPVVNKLRVVSDMGQNLRINADDGTVAVEDPDLNGDTTNLSAIAYTNNRAGATTTTLYGIEADNDRLYIVTDPNAGTTQTVGLLGIDVIAINGFDISPVDNTAYASLTVGTETRLYQIDLANGKASAVGLIGDGATGLVGLTAVTPGVISFDAAAETVDETAGTATVTLSRTGGSVGEVRVVVAVSGGTATAGTDFAGLPQEVVFADGELTKDVTFDITDDADIEGDETIVLSITQPTFGAGIGTQSTTTVTITDDEQPLDAGTISFADPIVNVNEGGGTVDITLNRTGSTTGEAKVTVVAGASSTATATDDYTGLPFEVTFADGESTATLTITIVDDAVEEGAESIVLGLTAPSDAVTIGDPSEAVVTIEANDGGVTDSGTVEFAISSLVVNEADGTATVTLSRSGTTTGSAGVVVSATGGSATAGVDYNGLPTTVLFGDGETSKAFTFAITQDTDDEPNETIFLTISDPSSGVTVGGKASLTVTILDDDGAPVTPPVSVSTTGFYAVGTGQGVAGKVNIYDAAGTLKSSFAPFDASFTGGVRTAYADVNGDGNPDLIAGTGPGRSTLVRVFDIFNANTLIFEVQPFEASFTGGVYVTAGDLNNDGKAEVVISPDQGGGPRVKIIDGATQATFKDFFGIEDLAFRGGARTAVGDVNGDGQLDLIVAAGFRGGPRIAAFDGAQLAAFQGTQPNQLPPKLFEDFFAFESSLRNGAFVASGDLNGDGKSEVIAGAGPNGGPRVFGIDGQGLIDSNAETLTAVTNYFAGDVNNRGGIRVVVKDIDGDNLADIVTGAGDSGGTNVSVYLGKNIDNPNSTPPSEDSFNAYSLNIPGGVYVG